MTRDGSLPAGKAGIWLSPRLTWLSHTGLEALERCPRCFWLRYKKGIYQPEGIVSRLANRFDIVLKNYFDIYRKKGGIPPLVAGKIEGKLQNPFEEKYFARINERFGFYGKLDECLISKEEKCVPIDFKTSSSDPRERETLSSYKSQIDDYLFLLEQNKKKNGGYGYLIYVFPDHGKLHSSFPMVIHVVKINGNPKNTEKRIKKAIKVLEEQIPQSNPDCPFCLYRAKVKEIEE